MNKNLYERWLESHGKKGDFQKFSFELMISEESERIKKILREKYQSYTFIQQYIDEKNNHAQNQ